IDGLIVDKAPVPAPIAVDPGPHDVEIRFDGRRDQDHVEAKSGETAEVFLALRILDPDPLATSAAMAPSSSSAFETPPNATTSGRTTLLGTGITLAVIGLLGGISTGVAALDLSAKRNASLGDKAKWEQLESQRFVLSNTAAWCLIAAG